MYQGKPVTKFFSNAKDRTGQILSNFHAAPIELNMTMDETIHNLSKCCPSLRDWLEACPNGTARFSCSEALWQALKVKTKQTFDLFHDNGLLGKGDVVAFLSFYKSPADADKAYRFWTRKNMIGVLYKMAVNPKHFKALGIKQDHMDVNREYLKNKTSKKIWLAILRLKYTQNPSYKDVLMDTGDTYLLEFDRHGGYWGGKLSASGELEGENTMGKYLMALREEFSFELES